MWKVNDLAREFDKELRKHSQVVGWSFGTKFVEELNFDNDEIEGFRIVIDWAVEDEIKQIVFTDAHMDRDDAVAEGIKKLRTLGSKAFEIQAKG